jgi:ABC-type nitrate/sulfonate/bicarbonate transport system substrate-binding protein
MTLVQHARALVAIAGLAAAMGLAPARAADTVIVGSVGSASTNLWPVHIGLKQGFFTAENLIVDLVYAQSNTGVVQQLAAGSVNMSVSTGLVDPIRAIDKGASLAIVRIEVQAPPYALLAKPALKSINELKGKTISLGGAKDITRIFVERMLAPNGIKPGEFDMVFAGATSARFSALQSGAVDAAILTAPFNFHAEAAGFTNLGMTTQYVTDLPFSGTIVNRTWAAANKPIAARFLSAYNKSIAWFQDSANRADAVRIMVEVSKLKAEDVEKGYDFLQKGNFFELTGKVSKGRLGKLVDALRELGDIEDATNVDRFLMPDVTQASD